MPCYRCGTRQTDPARGHSPWQRAVRGDQQVLVCPGCQGAHDWTADLDRCGQCGSVRLVRRLGEVECRECGSVASSPEVAVVNLDSGQALGLSSGHAPGLSEEVERALERVLGRGVQPPVRAPLS